MARLSIPQVVTLAGTVALTSVGGYAGYQHFAPKTASAAKITTADVQVGNLVSTISATGSVATPAQAKLSFKSSGRLTQLLANVGDQVAAGQPLARIDDSDLQVALIQAQASYNSAVAKLEQTKAGSTADEIATAQGAVDTARIKLQQTQAVTSGPEAAAAQSQVASAQLKLDQLLAGGTTGEVAAAQAQLDAASAKLQALADPRAEDLAAAQSQLNSAQSKLAALLNPRAEDVKSAQDAVTTAQAKLSALLNPRAEDLAAAQSGLDQAKTKLAQLQDQAKTATPEDIANAQLQVQSAQVAYDKAVADGGTVGKSGSTLTQAAADAAVKQALINVQTAQNNLSKLQNQGPTDWDVRQAQEAVNSAQVSLDKLKSPAPADVQAAQAAVTQAQATLDKLVKPSQYDVQQAQESVNSAQASLDKIKNPSAADVAAAQQAVASAQTALDKLQNPNSYDVAAAQQAVAQAQASYDKLVNGNGYDVQSAQITLSQTLASLDVKKAGVTVQDLAVAMAAVDQAQAQLKQAQANLDGATLTAPFAGTVAALGANLGEQASTAVVTLVDTSQLRVEVVVGESDIAKVKTGQTATLTFDALPNQRVNGTVSVVAPVPTTTNGVVNYTVLIQLDPQQAQAAGVRPGMTASASIVSDSRQNVVVAPNRAVKTQGRNKTVEVLDANGKTETRQVQTGLANDALTEIVSGLQAGDKVVIPSTTTAAARVAGLTGGAATLGGVPGAGFAGPPPGR